MSESESLLQTGSKAGYNWLVSTHTLTDVLRVCPDVVLEKYVAVTSVDSGPLKLSEQQRAAGWSISDGIGYSPKIQNLDALPLVWFTEWYVFPSPAHLGKLVRENIFESQIREGQVCDVVNYDFALDDAEYADLAQLFWQQLGRIKPESYLAENDFLNFATANDSVFASIRDGLSKLRGRR